MREVVVIMQVTHPYKEQWMLHCTNNHHCRWLSQQVLPYLHKNRLESMRMEKLLLEAVPSSYQEQANLVL